MSVDRGLIACVVVSMAFALAAGTEVLTQSAAQQPEFKTLKVEFVPGEKTIFFDDFSDMAPGAAPAHFKVRGAMPELQEAGGVRQLMFAQTATLYPNLTALPKNFTYEAEATFDAPNGTARLWVVFYSKGREAAAWGYFLKGGASDVLVTRKLPKFEELGRKRFTVDTRQPLKLALWLQEGRLRVFVNGESHVDANQVDLPPIDQVELRPDITGTGPKVAIRWVRFAESAPDISKSILSSGRYVTHGILFDTDSDRLKPESAAVIQGVAKALAAEPGLKLLIEGHTDSVGNAAHNLELSKRRAEAVKAVLVSQFAIDASRLTTAGLGATKPIDSNDTPLGRAQNRRVEFAKQ